MSAYLFLHPRSYAALTKAACVDRGHIDCAFTLNQMCIGPFLFVAASMGGFAQSPGCGFTSRIRPVPSAYPSCTRYPLTQGTRSPGRLCFALHCAAFTPQRRLSSAVLIRPCPENAPSAHWPTTHTRRLYVDAGWIFRLKSMCGVPWWIQDVLIMSTSGRWNGG